MSFIEPSTFSHSIMTVGVLEFTESHSGENIIDRIDAYNLIVPNTYYFSYKRYIYITKLQLLSVCLFVRC